ncbi:hypothetical protein AUC61_10935 [Pseudomonas sp. S25]|uniref:Peptidase n=1 Tax=Pseudomonas maioricensis TaxID=1766623 RepID=A0ABS9ZHN7_9PSED|nr:hypothetical protein [Pseudomonas sp. S25]MCI8210050.1 hypothetical protein [Pseudomonas sp. S25]
MQFSFDPALEFTLPIQKELEDMTRQAFATCKVQFSSPEDHPLPQCQFNIGGTLGNTGNRRGIHISFSNEAPFDMPSAKLEQLIHHEMVHFFQANLHKIEPDRYLPQWFYEGMAVAFSGQSVIARNSHLDDDYKYMGPGTSWENNFLTTTYAQGKASSYDSWGAMFIYAVTEQQSILPEHAVYGADGDLRAQVSAAECAKALAIISTAFEKGLKEGIEKGFNFALTHHTGKQQVTESGFRKFLAPD